MAISKLDDLSSGIECADASDDDKFEALTTIDDITGVCTFINITKVHMYILNTCII